MLGLVLVFFVGKYFFDLAGRYDKSEWGYAILGVISYYGGTFLMGIILGVLGEFGVMRAVEDIPSFVLTILAIPAGILTSFLLYRYLENRWDKPVIQETPADVLDAEFINQTPGSQNNEDTREKIS